MANTNLTPSQKKEETRQKIVAIRQKPAYAMTDQELMFIAGVTSLTDEENAAARSRSAIISWVQNAHRSDLSLMKNRDLKRLMHFNAMNAREEAELIRRKEQKRRSVSATQSSIPMQMGSSVFVQMPNGEPFTKEETEVEPLHTGTGRFASDDDYYQLSVGQKIHATISSALHEPIFMVAVAILLAVFILLRPYLVPSGSMEPTLQVGDRILSTAIYFPTGTTLNRGDIACFTAPSGDTYVKRVIGIGGDHIQISGEKVYVNGEESEWQGTGGVMSSMDVWLADDEYWMMGDNRGNSQDSRFIGAIKADKIISRVVAIYWPLDHATVF